MKNFKIIHSVLYSCCLILGMVFFIFTPKNNMSVAEKRKLSSIPAYSWKGILDGSIMKKYEFYIDDHFPFRGSLIDLAFVLNEKKGFQGKNNVRFITNTNNNSSNNEKNIDLNKASLDINYLANAESTSSKGLLIIAGRCFQVFGGSKGVVKTYIDMIQEYRDLLPANVRIFNCIVPTSSSFNFVKEYDYLRDNEFKNIDVAYSMSKAGIINVKAKEALVNHQNEIYFHIIGHMDNDNAISAFLALGQETRLNVFRLIVQRGDTGLTPSEIIETLGIPNATLSFHLKDLVDAELLLVVRQGRNLIYRPNAEHVQKLSDFLLDNCCGGKSCIPTKTFQKAKVK